MRFVVREVAGFANSAAGVTGTRDPGKSVHVLDRAYSYRCVFTVRTEDLFTAPCRRRRLSNAEKPGLARYIALMHAHWLEARCAARG